MPIIPCTISLSEQETDSRIKTFIILECLYYKMNVISLFFFVKGDLIMLYKIPTKQILCPVITFFMILYLPDTIFLMDWSIKLNSSLRSYLNIVCL